VARRLGPAIRDADAGPSTSLETVADHRLNRSTRRSVPQVNVSTDTFASPVESLEPGRCAVRGGNPEASTVGEDQIPRRIGEDRGEGDRRRSAFTGEDSGAVGWLKEVVSQVQAQMIIECVGGPRRSLEPGGRRHSAVELSARAVEAR
jgi:hypothetical protein